MTSAKCPLRLEIESRLRAWVLARYHRPLATLNFAELLAIAEHAAGSLRDVEASYPGALWGGLSEQPEVP